MIQNATRGCVCHVQHADAVYIITCRWGGVTSRSVGSVCTADVMFCSNKLHKIYRKNTTNQGNGELHHMICG